MALSHGQALEKIDACFEVLTKGMDQFMICAYDLNIAL